MFPAHQRFRAGKDWCILTHVKLGLVINLELSLGQRFPEVIQQLVFIQFLFVKLIIIIGYGLFIRVASGIGSHLRPVEAAFNVDAFIYIGVYAHAQVNPVAVCDGTVIKTRGGLLHHFLIMLAVAAIDQKGVGFQAAGEAAGFAEQQTDQVGNVAKDGIAVLLAVPLVDDMEMVDVHQDGIHGNLFITQIELLGVTEKILPVVEPGKGILFRRLDQFPVFCQFDGTFYPGQDNFRQRVRFGNEIAGAQLQAGNLGFMVGGQHDDGDVLHNFVVFYKLQQIEPVNPRHNQIQQDQGQFVAVVADGGQSLFAVLRKNNFILFRKNLPENHPVDHFIINHQHQVLFVFGIKGFVNLRHSIYLFSIYKLQKR